MYYTPLGRSNRYELKGLGDVQRDSLMIHNKDKAVNNEEMDEDAVIN